MDSAVSRQIGEFVLDAPIGSGGTAVVYRAHQPTVSRYVAIKLINAPVSTQPEDRDIFERRFTQEAQVLASLEHPYIVPIYHFGFVQDECAYIAMRLMHGSLADERYRFPLPAEQVVEITLQLLEGLAFAHQRGVIHRDIKPSNVLFDEAGSPCLADFGLTRITTQLGDPSRTSILSEAVYLAPEQIRRDVTDPRADIYSIGVLMYEMLTGRLPIHAENLSILAYLRKLEAEEPIPPRRLNGTIPPELERVVLQALRFEPRERFFDVQEIAEALSRLPGTRLRLPNAARPASGAPPRRKRGSRIQRRFVTAGALALAIIIVTLVVATLMFSQDQPLQMAVVTAGVRGSIESVIPTAAEIAQAQRALRPQGFIAYIACALNSQFQATSAREMGDFAASYGLTFRVYNSNGDAYRLLTLIEQARLEGARAIVLCPLKPEVLSESLTSLQSARIPLVLTDMLPQSYGGVMLDADNRQIGWRAGDFTAQALAADDAHSVNVVILDAPDYASSEARVQGYLDALSQLPATMEVVGRFPTADDQPASEAAVAELLRGGQAIDALFSVVDTGGYGAAAALSQAGAPYDSVVLTSVDAESLALNQIFNQQHLRASIDIGREMTARGAIDVAVKLLGGGTLPEIVSLPAGIIITRDIIMDNSS